ncbi:hypothetical protein MPTK1_2g06120 [Marchantia polymorpha subsp. ruderalis]|uniref:C2 domain-containing protein n=1 Tax=Marchantia polymorpha TaxID=3197 RepID=A0A2R6XDM3_MARPO|nr:hypothetical protein MARPO_0021s0067 [Marchantia polymorpha]BBN01278.1 hypothetical protein Mp_2g06120 [Marchantia polymorpha subsp. ruderalis]|eukprot:PTQ44203.1 hypothetical protein MARPO_0021s0067 [Marchantia polymorpha]
MPAGTVEVFLIGASGIKDTELFGKADPYATLACGKQKLRSNVATNQGSKPVWNQRFSFYIDDQATELQIKILNHNYLTEDDEIGSTTIPLAKVFAESKLPTTSYNVLRPSGRTQGEVKLSITFTAKKKAGTQPSSGRYGSVSGSVSSKPFPQPYVQGEPEPSHKHDPLRGPDGYHRKPNDSLPYGSGVGSWTNNNSDEGSTRPPYGSQPSYPSDSDGSSKPRHSGSSESGSTRPYPVPAASPSYPTGLYPPLGPRDKNESPATSYEYSLPANGSTHGTGYPHVHPYAPSAPVEYESNHYHQPPYEQHVTHLGEPGDHGGIPRPSQYPPIHHPSSPAGPSQKHRNADYLEDVTAGIQAIPLGHSADGSSQSYGAHPTTRPPPNPYPSGSSHGNYPGYPSGTGKMNERNPSEYPPPSVYPGGGYPPSEGSSHGKPPASEYSYHPPTYPPPAYPHSDSSSHGNYSAPPAGYPHQYSNHGPMSSHYPPQPPMYMGQHESYPPVPFYHAPPNHYVPAGYPK